jgi:hypothetical protein
MSIACSQVKPTDPPSSPEKAAHDHHDHQQLKRLFKLYSSLQDRFIEVSMKKKKYPLRVPLCFFFEYLGYSALLKYLPYLKPIDNEEERGKVRNYLSKAV